LYQGTKSASCLIAVGKLCRYAQHLEEYVQIQDQQVAAILETVGCLLAIGNTFAEAGFTLIQSESASE
jgi:hypothetical protein